MLNKIVLKVLWCHLQLLELNAIPVQGPIISSNPLSRIGRYIIDSQGARVKLLCASWPAHLDTNVPEGLSQASIESIAQLIPTLNLNCIRMTFSTAFTLDPYQIVSDAMDTIDVTESTLSGIEKNNPGVLDKTITNVISDIMNALGRNGIMVIMDNHVSASGWCCSTIDGWWKDSDNNGYSGFSVNDWLIGLSFLATTFTGDNVVGLSLRNEPRIVNNIDQWRKNMKKGAKVVNVIAPNLLIIVGGMNYARDLSNEALISLPSLLPSSIQQRFVYEGHQYSWPRLTNESMESTCSRYHESINASLYFVQTLGYPIFIGEWGLSLSSKKFDPAAPWFNCLFAGLLKYDLDSSVWLLISRFYIRSEKLDYVDPFAITNINMTGPENQNFINRLALLSYYKLNMTLGSTGTMLIHTQSGMCIMTGINNFLVLADCTTQNSAVWSPISDSWAALQHESGLCVSQSLQLVACTGASVVQASSDGIKIKIGSNTSWGCLTSNKLQLEESFTSAVSVSVCLGNNVGQWIAVI